MPSNPQAFPTENILHKGMTLRDYFAAKAMQGFLASSDGEDPPSAQGFAMVCYALADAMLEARNAAQ
jgi:hypothetical protein